MDVTVNGRSCAMPELHGVDRRLGFRYQDLFLAHISDASKLAAGFHANPALTTSFAATQACWRFLNNDAVTLPTLAQPLLEAARREIPNACDRHVLVVMDWSSLSFNTHSSKKHRKEVGRGNNLGYKAMTALAIGDRNGSVVAPVCLDLDAANGVHTTRADAPLESGSALDGLRPVMDHIVTELGDVQAAFPPVFIIDREGDSIGHFRDWDLGGHLFLVRADNEPTVLFEQNKLPLKTVADLLKTRQAFTFARMVEYKGKPARQFIAEAPVVLKRKASTRRMNPKTGKERVVRISGRPLSLRLVVSEVRDEQGTVLARWLLLSNVPASVDAATLALWYYWRWRIESYHKLLKGAGQQIEQWQQETPEAFARRLAIAAMACTVVWKLARDKTPAAKELRKVLVKLSGRQIERGRTRPDFTEPALLAGLGVLIPMLLLLEQYDLDELRRLTRELLPGVLRQTSGKLTIKDV